MPHDTLRLVQFLQVLLFLFSQRLTPGLNRLVDPFDTAETNDRAGNAFIDPCERYLAHFPAMLLGDFLHATDDLLVNRRSTGGRRGGLLLTGGARSGAESPWRSGEMTAAERCPLRRILSCCGLLTSMAHVHSHYGDDGAQKRFNGLVRTGINPTPVASQNLFISLSSSRYSKL